MNVLVDGARLAVGTFTAISVKPPSQVNQATAKVALLAAPFAAAPVGAVMGLVAYLATLAALPQLVVGALAVGVGVLGNRAFHLDGLADTVDALASSYDKDRALAVARTGDVGPAGATALVLVLLVQTAAAGAFSQLAWGPVLLGFYWCAARAAASIALRRGVRPAREDGLGQTFAESVPLPAVIGLWLLLTAAATAITVVIGQSPWAGPAAMIGAVTGSLVLVRRVTQRLGGIIGDAVGAVVEVAFAAMLVLALAFA